MTGKKIVEGVSDDRGASLTGGERDVPAVGVPAPRMSGGTR
jgi:hypothetical protein